jgi:hypothetical protein
MHPKRAGKGHLYARVRSGGRGAVAGKDKTGCGRCGCVRQNAWCAITENSNQHVKQLYTVLLYADLFRKSCYLENADRRI